MPRSLRRIFSQSIFVYALNPKTALFFLAFLPQFTDPSRGALWSQILFLGVLFVVSACVTDGLYALLAGTMGGRLRGNIRFWRTQRYLSGGVYIALGLTAAISGERK